MSQPEIVLAEKFLKRMFLMTCEQVNPRSGDCLVINMRYTVVPRETSDALSDNFHGFMKCVAVQREPSESKMISVAKHRGWYFAAVKGAEKFIIAQSKRSDGNRHDSF